MDSPSEKAEELDTEMDRQNQEDSSTSDGQHTETAEDSSNSEKSEDEPSTFDVVMSAIDPESEDDDDTEGKSDEDDSEASEDQSEKDESKDEEDNSEDEPSEEELKGWKPKTRERFQKLQEKHRTVCEKLEVAEQDASHYRQFVEFLDSNRITQDEANNLFNIGALMKNDPVKALEAITPYYQDLLKITGNILPEDLQQKVSEGYITKEHALELSRLRAAGQTNTVIQQDRTEHERRKEADQQKEQVSAMQNAIAVWEQKWSSSDPDYNSKKDRVLDRIELKLARASKNNSLPKTVQDAIDLANEAKAEVEKDMSLSVRKKEIDPVRGSGSNSSTPEPKNTTDVILRTLNQ
jgi:hypothetical protein